MTVFTLAELAHRFNLTLVGDSTRQICSVSTLSGASDSSLSFFANASYRGQLLQTRAGAVLIRAIDQANCPVNALISKNPHADFARIAGLFSPVTQALPGVHPTAVIEPGAHVHHSAQIGALCVIASSAVIGQGAIIGTQGFIGPHCSVGAYSELMPRVTLVKRVTLGRCVIIHSGAVIGADGFSFAQDAGQWLKVPQLGGVLIGDGCDIGANTTIDCGALEDTVLGVQVKLDNQIQIGHNVRIGDYTAIAGCTAIAGSATIGARCLIAGGVGIAGHLEICDGTSIMAMSLVSHSITEKGAYAGAMPLMPQREWRKNAVHLRRLDGTLRAKKATATPSDEKPSD
jgi:UDP-3-O-[3-hydroxymyristoyl] glucosamine N-acyltransferase